MKIMRSGRKTHRVAAIASDQGWWDGQLLKDCGVIPYLFYKNHQCEVSMVGGRRGEYPSLKYVRGLKMEFLADGGWQAKVDYVKKEAQDIDCILLYGCYPAYLPVIDIYKQRNPEGKVALALDANSGWMDAIRWTEPEFQRFMGLCDVITASSLVMQRHLNEKWPWAIEHIPNGFYHFTDSKWDTSFERKKNVILTASRLGTEQKATNVLLEAFAKIADKIDEWELHLAGPVVKEFEGYLNAFWSRYPQLRSRICFVGNLTDRDALYEEYLNAKIFALPSTFEGGMPNVIAEALYAGNTIAITRIDGYEEAIDRGACGMAAEIGSVDEFSHILLGLCQSESLSEMCRHAGKYARDHFDMEKIVARLYYMIFGEWN